MKSVLLVIDPQVGWQHPAVDDVFATIPEAMRHFKGLRAVTAYVNAPDSLFETQLAWTRFRESSDTQLIDGYAEHADAVFEHETYGCLTDDVDEFLKANEITDVYVCGVFTDICISQTAMQLFDAGYSAFVVQDLVGTLHGEDVHRATIKSLKHAIGQAHVIMADQLPNK